ncbi:hypothetical protein F5Y00DRAFT_267928 [Daldinia vernicosa]|uniref:uncharacterized protein n=1 Tax=Daldinia vernicosa TaxID=114800 RepID=UPI002008CDA1|nr:uncharacterized protein F5Y00DRAFT_267928 [Daldinia vernicosa]KAI0851262.1 hypothetical protein F5Y00DRAFT_267928 [Daldinia vernicosa]
MGPLTSKLHYPVVEPACDMARLEELESAACDVIQYVKQIHDLRHARLSVIGGLALMHYLPKYRSTDDINFITNISTSPSSLKKRLLERPDSPFFQRAQTLFYRAPSGREIVVDISPEWLSPYLPDSAVKVQDIARDQIPYISLTDLIVFKLDSSGLRSSPVKKERDAQDAAALVAFATDKSPLHLSERQEQIVEEALCDVARCGTKEKGWWENRMGLTKKAAADGPPHGSSPPHDNPGRGRKQSRPHSKSDPSPSRSPPLANDPNTAWHYERLDRGHMRRFNSLHSSSRSANGNHHNNSNNSNRPGTPRSSSQRMLRDTGCTMTQPKTTHASFQLGARRSGLSKEVSPDSNFCCDDEKCYNLEPGDGGESRSKNESGGCGSPAGHFDDDVTRTPPGGLGTVTEHDMMGGGGGGRSSSEEMSG